MDKVRIWCQDKLSNEYTNGIKSFIELAKNHLGNDNQTRCPCRHCRIVYIQNIDVVERHLWVKGFSQNYQNWIFHREPMIVSTVDNHSKGVQDDVEDEEDDDIMAALQDAAGGMYINVTGDDFPEEQNTSKEDFQIYFSKLKKSYTQVLNRWSNKSFDMLLQLLREAFPEGTKIGKSLYEWNKDLDKCPNCTEPRYKFENAKGKRTPHKILRWHKEKRPNKEGVLKHSTDGEAWKHFDEKFPTFSAEPQNVRLGLATDGFNHFGNMSNGYSMWLVILVSYNMPSWMCMKENIFMMSLLIPGPQAPGKDIDIYLRPLIDELKYLWDRGVMTYDVSKNENFRMHAAVLWTIHDFPAYGIVCRWSTKGYKACPICREDISS
ncbi:uncharacterized protein LOC111382773 [Olea europaea var. sylvestris]|uniref:uncharacterized protein LOC111382773 n=1 Tax=Olea europaea var. sylvestris TaxID=158386 RepID=UPI000C1D07A4|nr:uncharacterized protein LOC111382773 [Olea europaea var. sylvestris]